MQFKALPILTLAATSALAQTTPNPIIGDLATITTDTISLNDTVASWSGSLLTLLPIVLKSGQLLADIKSSTKNAKAAANLTFDETLQVASATTSLATDVNQTITTIIAAKHKFDKLLVVDPVILLNLKLEQDATREFSAAVVSKVPVALQAIAQGITKGIDDSFTQGLNAYEFKL